MGWQHLPTGAMSVLNNTAFHKKHKVYGNGAFGNGGPPQALADCSLWFHSPVPSDSPCRQRFMVIYLNVHSLRADICRH